MCISTELGQKYLREGRQQRTQALEDISHLFGLCLHRLSAIKMCSGRNKGSQVAWPAGLGLLGVPVDFVLEPLKRDTGCYQMNFLAVCA